MPNIINVDPDGGTFTRDNWKEALTNGGFKQGGPDVFSNDNCEAVLVGFIDWDLRYSFLKAVLGYSYLDNLSLVRNTPLQHPWFSWLYASSASIESVQVTADDLKRDAPDPDKAFDYAGYNKAKVSIHFTPLPYVVKEDDEINTYNSGNAEWERYFWDSDCEGSLQVISQAGRRLYFAEGDVASPFYPKGIPFPTDLGVYAYQTNRKFMWEDVALEYVCGVDGDSFTLPKIDAAVGCVNETDFLGFKAGTLLMNPYRIIRKQWPLLTTDTSIFKLSIEFNMVYFNPASGVSPQTYYGHNLQPWGGNTDLVGGRAPSSTAGIGKWYYSTNDGTTGGSPLLPSYEFRNCFEAADA